MQLDVQNLYINTPSDPKDLDIVNAYEKSPTYFQDQLWGFVPYDGYYQIILASNPNLSLFLVEGHIRLKSPSLSDDKSLWLKIDNGDGTFILRNKFRDPSLGDNNYLTLASGAVNNTPLTISFDKSEAVSIKMVSP